MVNQVRLSGLLWRSEARLVRAGLSMSRSMGVIYGVKCRGFLFHPVTAVGCEAGIDTVLEA